MAKEKSAKRKSNTGGVFKPIKILSCSGGSRTMTALKTDKVRRYNVSPRLVQILRRWGAPDEKRINRFK